MELSNSTLKYWYDKVWNQQDESVIDQLIHPDAVIYGLGLDPTRRGPDLFREFYHSFRAEFVDISVAVLRVVAEDDYETALCTVMARHRTTDRIVSFSGLNMVSLRAGQIYETWNQFDFTSLHRQLAPEPLALTNGR